MTNERIALMNGTEGDTIMLAAGERNKERELEIIATLPGGEQFKRFIWIQDTPTRKQYLAGLVAEYPGIGTEEQIRLRDELNKIAKDNLLDLVVHPPHGKVNGSAKTSIDWYYGKANLLTDSGNLFSSSQRREWGQAIGEKWHKKDKRRSAEYYAKLVEDRLLAECTKARTLAAAVVEQQSTFVEEKIPYEIVNGVGIVMRRPGQVAVQLTNFVAKITAEVTRDDGSTEPSREFALEVTTRSGRQRLNLRASEFQEMAWPLEKLGTRGHVRPGRGIKEAACDAIVRLSGEPPERRVQVCPGWIKDDKGKWIYVHAGGCISGSDETPAVDVELDAGISDYELPAPAADPMAVKTAIQASLKILQLAKAELVYPVYCQIGLAPLGVSDFIVNLVGPTGSFKSELASLAARHFGKKMNSRNLPAQWDGTANALGELLFLARDVLLVIDDFKLKGSLQEQQRQHAKADTVFRFQGNGKGKVRMKDGSGGLRENRPARGTVLSTSEHVPQGQSCVARGLMVEVAQGDIPSSTLLDRQREAEDGLYAYAYATYIRWLAEDGRIEGVRRAMPELIRKYRERANSSDLHKRTPEIVAQLYVGIRYWLAFCVESDAISSDDAKRIEETAWTALGNVAMQQAAGHAGTDPVNRYLELLMSAVGSGKAHLASDEGAAPDNSIATACGWWRRIEGAAWEPRGACIGFVRPDGVFLIPDAAYAAALAAAGGNSGLFEPEPDLRKRLDEKGLLGGKDGGKLNRRTVRPRLAGLYRTVLWLKPGVLPIELGEGDFSGQVSTPPLGLRALRAQDQLTFADPDSDSETRKS